MYEELKDLIDQHDPDRVLRALAYVIYHAVDEPPEHDPVTYELADLIIHAYSYNSVAEGLQHCDRLRLDADTLEELRELL